MSELELLGEPEYIRLRSFYFMSISEDYQPISRVTCIFDNGAKSPNISSRDCHHERQGMVEFDPARPITKIKFSVYAQYKMPSIGFFDGEG